MNAPATFPVNAPAKPGEFWMVYQCANPKCRAVHARRYDPARTNDYLAFTLDTLRTHKPPNLKIVPINLDFIIEMWVP